MSWTDQQSIRVIKYLANKFGINTLVETGTYKGINARLHSKNFRRVITVEENTIYYEDAVNNLKDYKRVKIVNSDSSTFLKKLSDKPYVYYLDAHFYDPTRKQKFVVLEELRALKGKKNGIIIIHDFDNGLGHLNYDGQSLNLELIKKDLFNVNPNFHLYTNELSSCDIVKPTIESMEEAGLMVDKDTLGNLEYAWKEPRLTFRGILYCLPSKLTKQEMTELGLKNWK